MHQPIEDDLALHPIPGVYGVVLGMENRLSAEMALFAYSSHKHPRLVPGRIVSLLGYARIQHALRRSLSLGPLHWLR